MQNGLSSFSVYQPTKKKSLFGRMAGSLQSRPQSIPPCVSHSWYWAENLGFVGSGILALILTTWRLSENGFANLYYAASVKSMETNWHAFFFASFDPGGFISIDKPPLGFWIQVLSVRLLGFTPWALLLPEAIAGAIAPPLLGVLVRRGFNGAAGLLAAFALACTPIWIVASRDNIVDVPLALTLLLAAAALLQAIAGSSQPDQKNVTRRKWVECCWLILAFALIGLGFNIKMLEAYLVVPAFVLTYFLFSTLSFVTRSAVLLLALVVMIGVSFAWIEFVDLTPASARPYVGSTTTNSELALAVGYNGLGRLLGNNVAAGAPFQFADPLPSTRVGEAGALRFLQPELGSQISWFLPIALLGLFAAWPFGIKEHRKETSRQSARHASSTPNAHEGSAGSPPPRISQAGYVLWGSWLLTGLVVFSVGRDIDTYYLAIIAPPLCAIAGFGVIAFRRPSGTLHWRWWLFLIAVAVTLIEQLYLLHSAPKWDTWLQPVIIGTSLAIVFMYTLLHIYRRRKIRGKEMYRGMSTSSAGNGQPLVLIFACFLAPVLWTLSSLTPGNASSHPIAGPEYAQPVTQSSVRVDPKLITYLAEHRNNASYFLGVQKLSCLCPDDHYNGRANHDHWGI